MTSAQVVEPPLGTLDSLLWLRAGPGGYIGAPTPIAGFGGLLMGRALVAASVDIAGGRVPHSLQASFLLPVNTDSDDPVTYRVEPMRDGRAFSVRRVDITQGVRTLASALVSLHTETEDPDRWAAHSAQRPHEHSHLLRSTDAGYHGIVASIAEVSSLEAWYVPPRGAEHAAEDPVWVRAPAASRSVAPPAAVLAMISDLTAFLSVIDRSGADHENLQVATLSHSLWIHSRALPDEWFSIRQVSAGHGRGRGLARIEICSPDGALLATAAQEGLLRRIGSRTRAV